MHSPAVAMGGWWLFVGALAGIITGPLGIHGRRFWCFHLSTSFVLLCRSGALRDRTHFRAKDSKFWSDLVTLATFKHSIRRPCSLRTEILAGEREFWPEFSFTPCWDSFLLIERTVKVTYSLSWVTRNPLKDSGGDEIPAFEPLERTVCLERGQRFKTVPFQHLELKW